MLDNSSLSNTMKYWDEYYSEDNNSSYNIPPSQFAAFCLSEMKEMAITNLVEIASGNGRDALFFANHGVKVLATDNSKEALKLLEAKFIKHKNIRVLHHDATEKFLDFEKHSNPQTAFYARFFIHTLNDCGLQRFFENISSVMRSGDILFLEYRNVGDASGTKITKAHFRAFHEADKISKISKENYLKLTYEISGKGFAKWRQDDASITRQVFQYVEK